MPTNVYDVTFPPDTQLANLLGQDLRNLALNVQQRMALISGTLAARWNPSLDTQPLNWTGLLYFATDTSQVFQWSGAAWVEVTQSVIPSRSIFKDNTAHVHTGTVTEDVIYTVNIPGNSLGLNGALRITCFYNQTAITGTVTLRVKFGGTTFLTNTNASQFPGRLFVYIGNRGAANVQIVNTDLNFPGASAIFEGVGAIDTTIAQSFVITMQNTNAPDSQTFNQIIVEQL